MMCEQIRLFGETRYLIPRIACLSLHINSFYRELWGFVNNYQHAFQTHMFTIEEDWLWKELFHSAYQKTSQIWLLSMKIVKYQVSFTDENLFIQF